jgi:hypothetical protein
MDQEINSNDRLNLKKLISECETIDNTEYIRQVKHSVPLAKDIQTMERLKMQNMTLRTSHPDQFAEICESQCGFLFNNYMDIFKKLLKDEINLQIMQQFLHVLNMIEDGLVDQHEGSVIIGKILKELYLDSAIRRGEHLDQENPPVPRVEGKQIGWNQFKTIFRKEDDF